VERLEEIIELLRQIEQNQRKALEAQEEHLALAKAQLERSNQTIQESIDLQRLAVARQAQARNVGLPVILVLLFLLVYLMVKWGIL